MFMIFLSQAILTKILYTHPPKRKAQTRSHRGVVQMFFPVGGFKHAYVHPEIGDDPIWRAYWLNAPTSSV